MVISMNEPFTDEKITGILSEVESSAMSIKVLCRTHNITKQISFH